MAGNPVPGSSPNDPWGGPTPKGWWQKAMAEVNKQMSSMKKSASKFITKMRFK
jgi:hypothetical protein